MSIPNNIEKKHILNALSKIDTEGIPKDAESRYYDLIYNGNNYPPKLVISYANIFANGSELDRNSFSGGLNTQCFKILEENGFNIQEKPKVNKFGFYQELQNFLSQSATNELGTSDYLNEYQGLTVKVSFGKGNQARIPWIAFLDEINTVQQGIYPVYLYYKEIKLLILAFGLSETNIPNRTWDITNQKSIKQYFIENNLGKPERYGTSLIYKVYDTNKNLVENTINQDLSEIIMIYKTTTSSNVILDNTGGFKYSDFNVNAQNSGLYYSSVTCLRFISSLLTKPFVILTGLSGSGKTKLAQAFALWICQNTEQYCIVPVGADWTNREPMLGFPNALKDKEYVAPESSVLDLIIKANKNPDLPYFLILDEMNMSHVERYFADFLSVMESKNKISLHSGLEFWGDIPHEISLPSNLFIIGTVNIDETTYMFSPKVLDRANVIEFRVTYQEMNDFLSANSIMNLGLLAGKGVGMANDFVQMAKNSHPLSKDKEIYIESLMDFFAELKKTGAEFGYRSASEILRFAAIINGLEPKITSSDILDAAIMQKLLPKVHGSRRKLVPVLETLGHLCLREKLKEGLKIEQYLINSEDIDLSGLIKYPLTFEKISRMYRNLLHNGFTSFAEA